MCKKYNPSFGNTFCTVDKLLKEVSKKNFYFNALLLSLVIAATNSFLIDRSGPC